MSIYLGIDIGTQGVKALCFDGGSGSVVAGSSASLELISRSDGAREQEAGWWLVALRRCLGDIPPAIREAICAVGVSGQQHGFVALDASGQVLAPVKLWCDTSTAAECAVITEAFGGEQRCLEQVGNTILPGYTASKILWLKRAHPGLYQRMRTILLPHDYLNFYLTGERVMECGDASGTGLLDIRRRKWHREMLAALDGERDLGEALPRLVSPGEFIGTVHAGAAMELGLPANIPVSCGGGDNMMAAIGTGNVAPGRLTVSLGTSGTLFAYSDRAIVDESGTLAAFCDSTGGWLPLLCTMNCTVATELTRNALDLSLPDMEARIAAVPAGAHGVLTLPFFQGERTPNLPAASGSVFGLTTENYSPDNLLRSAMESAVYGLRLGLDAFLRQDMRFEQVRVTGGGARSGVWRQMLADVFEQPVSAQKIDEGAALGAALQAFTVHQKGGGAGQLSELLDAVLGIDQERWCEPCERNSMAYREHYARYLRHIEALTPMYSHNQARISA